MASTAEDKDSMDKKVHRRRFWSASMLQRKGRDALHRKTPKARTKARGLTNQPQEERQTGICNAGEAAGSEVR